MHRVSVCNTPPVGAVDIVRWKKQLCIAVNEPLVRLPAGDIMHEWACIESLACWLTFQRMICTVLTRLGHLGISTFLAYF